VEVNTAGPRTDLRLNVPEGVTATPVAGGRIRLDWRYAWRPGGEDAATFQVFVNNNSAGPPSFTTPTATVAATDEGDSFTVYTWTSDVLTGARWFTVRAAAAGTGPGSTTTNIDQVAALPDATAPTLSGPLQGVAT